MRNEPNATRKAQLGEFVNSYMDRMEQLQKQIDIRKQNASVFTKTNDISMKNYTPASLTDKSQSTSKNKGTVGAPTGKPFSTSNTNSANAAIRSASPIPQKTPLPTTTKPKLSEYENSILNDMLDQSPGVSWDDIAGLVTAKQILQEAVVLPNLRPDLFTGNSLSTTYYIYFYSQYTSLYK